MASINLRTDRQFERAYLSKSTVCVRDKCRYENAFIGGLESFNPIIVTVGGKKFLRDDYEFVSIR